MIRIKKLRFVQPDTALCKSFHGLSGELVFGRRLVGWRRFEESVRQQVLKPRTFLCVRRRGQRTADIAKKRNVRIAQFDIGARVVAAGGRHGATHSLVYSRRNYSTPTGGVAGAIQARPVPALT